MSIKTPEQIADEHGPEGMHNLIEASRVRAYMVAAIEADRAQRDLIEGLRQSAAGETVDLGSFAQYADEEDQDA